MLQNTYQTKVPLHCWYLQHRIPLSSFLALLLGIVVSAMVDMLVSNVCYAVEPTASLELSTNQLTGQGTNEAAVIANTRVTVNVSSANTYTLTLKMDKLELTNGTTTIAPGNAVSDNTWGYKWEEESSYTTPQANGNNLAVPSLANHTASFSKNLVFAAKFGKDAEAGHYKTSGVLSLVATPATTTYTITYDANGGNNAPASQACTVQDVTGANCTTTLSNSKPTRTNYTFLGWADSSSATSKQYDAGGSITVSSNKTIYAVWKLSNGVWIYNNGNLYNSGITTMQQMTKNVCDQMTTPSSSAADNMIPKITLEDTRDGNVYTVKKFADGRCWMAENLHIVGTIQASDSDFSSPSSLTLPNSSAGFNDSTKFQLNAYVVNGTGYYNWYTATAQAGNSTVTASYTPVNTSICPKNWKLPTGGSGEFQAFAEAGGIADSAAGSTKIRSAPYNFIYTGYMYDGSGPQNIASQGFWWSSTAYSNYRAFALYIDSSRAYPATYTTDAPGPGRRAGGAVRCVARTSNYDSAPE